MRSWYGRAEGWTSCWRGGVLKIELWQWRLTGALCCDKKKGALVESPYLVSEKQAALH